MSAALVWQVIKKDNAFVRRGLNGAIFSAERGNVYNRHSYSQSGLVNAKSIDVSVDAKTDAVTVGYGSAKNANKPSKAVTTFTVKKNARRALKALGKQAASYRPDLKKGAVARLAAIHKSLRVKKYTK